MLNSFETPTNPIHHIEHYKELKLRLERDPQSVVNDLETLRNSLLDARAMRFSVVGDLAKIEKPSSTWLDCFEPIKTFPECRLCRILISSQLSLTLNSSKF
jgi:Zn-dependent M16 (insulinase) family peptidase